MPPVDGRIVPVELITCTPPLTYSVPSVFKVALLSASATTTSVGVVNKL